MLSVFKKALLLFATSFRFLTIVPLSWKAGDDHTRFERCLGFFPVVGLVIGGICCALTGLCALFFPPTVVAVIGMVFLAGISGCMHLDGLADSADGLLSSRPREVMLRIMKDSRSGVMGVLAVCFILLLKFAALTSLDGHEVLIALFLMPIVGRTAILFTMARLPYAREEGGLGLLFYSDATRKTALIALILVSIFISIFFTAQFLQIFVFVSLWVLLFDNWCSCKLGGATGDTLGAVCEIAETATALVFTFNY